MFSDLNLDAEAPVRARPGVGEWGPVQVTTTASKKRGRIVTALFFVVVLAVLVAAGTFWFLQIHG